MNSMNESIDRLDSWVVPVSLRRPHIMSFGSIAHATLVVVRVTSSNGATGWGETTILGGPYWNEESSESVHAILTRYLFPQLVGLAVNDHASIRGVVGSIRRNLFAKSALDIALHDLRARLAGVSVASYLGGRSNLTLPVSWSLANGDVEADLDELTEKLEAGHHIFKIKMGSAPLTKDLDRAMRAREQAGVEISLRVDANQGWTRAEAGRAIAVLDELDVDFVEQPLVKADLEGSRRLQSTTALPIAADESLETLDDGVRIVSGDVARVFVYKLAKHGGYRGSLDIASLGSSHGVGGYLGCMIESSIGTAACMALAAAAPPLAYGCELFGPALLAEDLVDEPLITRAGQICLPSGTGLGVEVDIAKLEQLALRHDGVHA